MIGILMPEIIIYNTLNSIIKLLREDLKDNNLDDTKTLLYKLLGIDENGETIKMNLYVFFEQAKKIFSKEDNLSVNFGYNQKASQNVTLHIILPSEEGRMSIGADEGYITEDILDNNENKIGTQNYFTQVYDTTYQIMISGNNSSEINVVYNVLKSMLLILTPHLELMGLRLPKLSGNDIVMQDDLAPIPFFHKVINFSFTYECNVPQLITNEIAKKFYFMMRLVDYNDNVN